MFYLYFKRNRNISGFFLVFYFFEFIVNKIVKSREKEEEKLEGKSQCVCVGSKEAISSRR